MEETMPLPIFVNQPQMLVAVPQELNPRGFRGRIAVSPEVMIIFVEPILPPLCNRCGEEFFKWHEKVSDTNLCRLAKDVVEANGSETRPAAFTFWTRCEQSKKQRPLVCVRHPIQRNNEPELSVLLHQQVTYLRSPTVGRASRR